MANYSPMACTVGANIAILKVIGGENVVSNLPQHTKKKQVKGKCKVAIWQKYLVFQPSEDISIGMDKEPMCQMQPLASYLWSGWKQINAGFQNKMFSGCGIMHNLDLGMVWVL